MPQIQTFDLAARPRTEPTSFERTVSAFANRQRENQLERQDTDALSEIYSQYKNQSQTIDDALMAVQTKQGLSPTARVHAANHLMEMKKTNHELQKATQAQKEKQDAADRKKAQVRDIEKKRGLEEGSLSAYDDNPNLANSISKPAASVQSEKPITDEQLSKIRNIRSQEGFSELSPSEQYRALTDAGVSRANAEAEAKLRAEELKGQNAREAEIGKKSAISDFDFVQDQVQKEPDLFKRKDTLQAANKLNSEGVTGGLWDQAMQRAGLLQFNTQGYREFASYAKDAIKNQNIKSIVGSQISQMEFQFFRDATISERFSQAANEQIIKKEMLAIQYEELYGDITKRIIEQNNGKIPEGIQSKVNSIFAEESKKISNKVRKAKINFDAVQKVPEGKVLMFDKERNPIHVDEDKVKWASDNGATLS